MGKEYRKPTWLAAGDRPATRRIWLSWAWGDQVAGQDDLDATISGATLGRVVGGDRPRRPQAFDIDGRCLHALRDQVVAYRDGAIVRQPAVELVAAGTVGVALHAQFHGSIHADDPCEPRQRHLRVLVER